MSKGVLYGVGTGPGEPELLTIKAVRTIESCPVIAAPQTADGAMVALDIVRGGYDDVRRAIGWPGTKVVMKARRSLADTKRILREESAFDGAELVEGCGLPGERVYRSLDDVPDRGSYFSTMVVR
ncbi:SAM-dependent methyltransferase [Senegalimassilia anaerobia]|uniref:SAM-dependent methyltransferase n=1 Tax=Senegalimassilia anaerobia TaxID=1473216 RepID=UPI0005A9A4CC|nr:SAM-dependent methyltransferase [Senegalimassilia anaerobia]